MFIELLISMVLSISLCTCAIHYIFTILIAYNRVQEKFAAQHAKLVARHYIGTDLYKFAYDVATCKAKAEFCSHLLTPAIDTLITNQTIKPFSDILILHTQQGDIVYYLRKSRLSTPTNITYALYRDDIKHNAVAIVENITNFNTKILNKDLIKYVVESNIVFTNAEVLQIKCTVERH